MTMLLRILNSPLKIHSISMCQNLIQEPFQIAVHTSFPFSFVWILFAPLLNSQSFMYRVINQEIFEILRELKSLFGSNLLCV